MGNHQLALSVYLGGVSVTEMQCQSDKKEKKIRREVMPPLND